jgi:hypothetical protein
LSRRDGIIANSAAGIARVRCGIADCRIAAVVRVRGKGGVRRGQIAKNRVAVVGVDGAVVVRAAVAVAPVAWRCFSWRREEGVEEGVAVRGATIDRVARDVIAVAAASVPRAKATLADRLPAAATARTGARSAGIASCSATDGPAALGADGPAAPSAAGDSLATTV